MSYRDHRDLPRWFRSWWLTLQAGCMLCFAIGSLIGFLIDVSDPFLLGLLAAILFLAQYVERNR